MVNVLVYRDYYPKESHDSTTYCFLEYVFILTHG